MIEELICKVTVEALKHLFGINIDSEIVSVQRTRKEFEGDYTIVVFPFVRFSKKDPQSTAQQIGDYLIENVPDVVKFNVIKGFLNLSVGDKYWLSFLKANEKNIDFGKNTYQKPSTFVVEYSSPNTNKPLHLGHIRNNLLGYSVAEILKYAGNKVHKVNLVNDRGIHICKSMLAWQQWGEGETPESTGMKGDFFVGKYYVLFEQYYKKEREILIAQGLSEEDAAKNAPLIQQAQEMLRLWENKDKDVISLWKKMNKWVLDGFDVTYKKLGIDFDKIYYESETYLYGKVIIEEGLNNKVFYRKPDNSVWIDLTNEGLDEKLLLRSDGTSVYMTQDIGTAQLRKNDFDADKFIYVVGNEQNYHFEVLKHVLKKLGKDWADGLFHLSYGMVELPEGKMKSREGKVVDADDLINEMIETARKQTEELGKIEDFNNEEAKKLFNILALGAIKYFILKVDPKKNMIFNPEESIDFNGNTGPFIQYSYVRINSLLKKAESLNLLTVEKDFSALNIDEKEKSLLKLIHDFPAIIEEAANTLSPALIANFLYEVAKEYNQFYHDFPVLKEPDDTKAYFRIKLTEFTGFVVKKGLSLLGIGVPERM